jgi:hypothetical protein
MLIIDLFNSIESATKNPVEADFLNLLQQLDNSIESPRQLPAVGDAIEQLAKIYSGRAEAKFAEIKWLNNPHHEPTISLSEFDRYIRQSCVLDLDRFTIDRERCYPENRADAILADRMMVEVLESIIEDEKPLIDTAHDENIEAWVQMTLDRIQSGMNFTEVILSLSLGQVWLSVLLSDNRIKLVRSHGDFYDVDGLIFD